MEAAVILQVEQNYVEIWNFEKRKIEKIVDWDKKLIDDLLPTIWVILDRSKIIATISQIFATRMQGNHIEMRIPYIRLDKCYVTYEKPANNFIGWAPFFGRIANFTTGFNMENNELYWVWVSNISEKKDFQELKEKIGCQDCEWMAKFTDVEKLNAQENHAWLVKVDGLILEKRGSDSYLIWDKDYGYSVFYHKKEVSLGDWFSYYVLQFPDLEYSIAYKPEKVTWPPHLIDIYKKENADTTKLELSYYLNISLKEFSTGQYNAPKLGYIYDTNQIIPEEWINFNVKVFIAFDEKDDKWIFTKAYKIKTYLSIVACVFDDMVHLFSLDFDFTKGKTIVVDMNSNNFLKEQKPELGNVFMVSLDYKMNVDLAFKSTAKKPFQARVKGNDPFLMINTPIKVIGRQQGHIIGYSKELGIKVVDNSGRLEPFKENLIYSVDICYWKNPTDDNHWLVHRFTKKTLCNPFEEGYQPPIFFKDVSSTQESNDSKKKLLEVSFCEHSDYIFE